jgi:hypothetical protein
MKNINNVINKLPEKRRAKIAARADELIQETKSIVRPVLRPAPYEPRQILIKKKSDA